MTRPSRIVVDVERIVLEGVGLDAAGIDAARTAIVEGLTTWLAELDPSALQSLATARMIATVPAWDLPPDGRALGTTVAGAIRDAVEPSDKAGSPGPVDRGDTP